MNSKVVGLWILIAAVSGCTQKLVSADPVSGDACLSEEEVELNGERANNGNAEAARLLVVHFDVCAGDRDLALRWMRVGASLGDVELRKSLIQELQRMRVPAEMLEAKSLAHGWGMDGLLISE